ncbi:hypothetical protein EC917_13537 [Bacillus thuringiensis]|uniref:Uncharacterized protein n=1 Tax=Bacillus thuringiensis TaxID=1428 RepID=A0A4R4AX34_BACTU|nr:hypothetical protein [Bacillus thuringiensis]TCW44488.1 hypothetical protein EC917_13537 [Bacillus thuringiensis]TCW45007.1 hypothetical protein EC910_1342 [Bacillus thuringiensis]
MKVQKIQEKIDKLNYWDAWVTKLECNYIGDEVIMIFKDRDKDVTLQFSGCYKIDFKHSMGFEKEKPIKTYTYEQLPYFLHDIEIGEVEKECLKLYTCKITMPPVDLEIWYTDIKIER